MTEPHSPAPIVHHAPATPLFQMPVYPSASEKFLALSVFWSRWLQAPLYLGLIIAQAIYVILFLKTLWDLILKLGVLFEEAGNPTAGSEIMLVVLELIDVVMISNLLVMVIIGGYETFVSRLRMDNHPDKPEWLSHMNANTMKIKLAMALIGISSIHLLKTFINVEHVEPFSVMWQAILHSIFLVSALAIAGTAWLSTRVLLAEAEHTRIHHAVLEELHHG